MKLSVHSNGLDTTTTVREHLERRLAFALGRFGDEVGQVWARLADQNGPKGGVDKVVSLRVRGARIGTLIVAEEDSTLYAAIDRAADRIGRAFGRALERANDRRLRVLRPSPDRTRTPRGR